MEKDAKTTIFVLFFIGCLASTALGARDAAVTSSESCDSYRKTLADLTHQTEESTAQLHSTMASLTTLRANLTETDAARCAANFDYVDSLRKTRKWITALQSLKEWISTSVQSTDVEGRGQILASISGLLTFETFSEDNIIDVNAFVESVAAGSLVQSENGAIVSETEVYGKIEQRLAELSNKITSLVEEELKAGEEHADYLDVSELEDQKQEAAINSLSAQLVSLNGEIKAVQAQLQQCGAN